MFRRSNPTRLCRAEVSRQYGASEITPDKKIVWDYDGPPGTEIHTAYPIGMDKVLIMQNGGPAKLLVIHKAANKVENEIVLPTRDPRGVHGQFRRVRPRHGPPCA